MAVHGKNTGVLIGQYDPTTYFTDYTASNSIDVAESTGFQKQAKEYVIGQSDGTVSFTGRYQGSKAQAERVFERIQDNSDGDPFLIATQGWRTGTRCRMGVGLKVGADISASIGDVVGTSASLQAHGGIQWGWYLGKLDVTTATTVATGTTDTGLDGAASGFVTTVAQYHAVTDTWSGSVTVKFQHSTDGSTWVDMPSASVVIPGASGPSSGRIPIAHPGARYLRGYVTTATGTGALSIHLAIAPTI